MFSKACAKKIILGGVLAVFLMGQFSVDVYSAPATSKFGASIDSQDRAHWDEFEDSLDDPELEGFSKMVGGVVITAVASYFAPGIGTAAASSMTGLAATAVEIGVSSAVVGTAAGISSEINGGNFGDGFYRGALTHGALQGFDAAVQADVLGENFKAAYNTSNSVLGKDIQVVKMASNAGVGSMVGAGISGITGEDVMMGAIGGGMQGAMSKGVSDVGKFSWHNFAKKSMIGVGSGYAGGMVSKYIGIEYQDEIRDTYREARRQDWSDEKLEDEIDDLQEDQIKSSMIYSSLASAAVQGAMGVLLDDRQTKKVYEKPGGENNSKKVEVMKVTDEEVYWKPSEENQGAIKEYNITPTKEFFDTFGGKSTTIRYTTTSPEQAQQFFGKREFSLVQQDFFPDVSFGDVAKGAFKGAAIGGISGFAAAKAYTSVNYRDNPEKAQMFSNIARYGGVLVGSGIVEYGPSVIKSLGPGEKHDTFSSTTDKTDHTYAQVVDLSEGLHPSQSPENVGLTPDDKMLLKKWYGNEPKQSGPQVYVKVDNENLPTILKEKLPLIVSGVRFEPGGYTHQISGGTQTIAFSNSGQFKVELTTEVSLGGAYVKGGSIYSGEGEYIDSVGDVPDFSEKYSLKSFPDALSMGSVIGPDSPSSGMIVSKNPSFLQAIGNMGRGIFNSLRSPSNLSYIASEYTGYALTKSGVFDGGGVGNYMARKAVISSAQRMASSVVGIGVKYAKLYDTPVASSLSYVNPVLEKKWSRNFIKGKRKVEIAKKIEALRNKYGDIEHLDPNSELAKEVGKVLGLKEGQSLDGGAAFREEAANSVAEQLVETRSWGSSTSDKVDKLAARIRLEDEIKNISSKKFNSLVTDVVYHNLAGKPEVTGISEGEVVLANPDTWHPAVQEIWNSFKVSRFRGVMDAISTAPDYYKNKQIEDLRDKYGSSFDYALSSGVRSSYQQNIYDEYTDINERSTRRKYLLASGLAFVDGALSGFKPRTEGYLTGSKLKEKLNDIMGPDYSRAENETMPWLLGALASVGETNINIIREVATFDYPRTHSKGNLLDMSPLEYGNYLGQAASFNKRIDGGYYSDYMKEACEYQLRLRAGSSLAHFKPIAKFAGVRYKVGGYTKRPAIYLEGVKMELTEGALSKIRNDLKNDKFEKETKEFLSQLELDLSGEEEEDIAKLKIKNALNSSSDLLGDSNKGVVRKDLTKAGYLQITQSQFDDLENKFGKDSFSRQDSPGAIVRKVMQKRQKEGISNDELYKGNSSITVGEGLFVKSGKTEVFWDLFNPYTVGSGDIRRVPVGGYNRNMPLTYSDYAPKKRLDPFIDGLFTGKGVERPPVIHQYLPAPSSTKPEIE